MPELPPDFAARLRAAVGYSGAAGRREFAERLNYKGLSEQNLDNFAQGKLPPKRSAEAYIRRIAEVSGLPEAFFWGEAFPASTPLEDQILKLRAELAARDAEVKKRIAGIERSIQGLTRRPPPP
jgi:hypothetical protein